MRGNTGGQLEMIKQIQTNRKMENGSTKKFTFVGITSSKDVTGLRKSNEWLVGNGAQIKLNNIIYFRNT